MVSLVAVRRLQVEAQLRGFCGVSRRVRYWVLRTDQNSRHPCGDDNSFMGRSDSGHPDLQKSSTGWRQHCSRIYNKAQNDH